VEEDGPKTAGFRIRAFLSSHREGRNVTVHCIKQRLYVEESIAEQRWYSIQQTYLYSAEEAVLDSE
jgi:hypothetical protein